MKKILSLSFKECPICLDLLDPNKAVLVRDQCDVVASDGLKDVASHDFHVKCLYDWIVQNQNNNHPVMCPVGNVQLDPVTIIKTLRDSGQALSQKEIKVCVADGKLPVLQSAEILPADHKQQIDDDNALAVQLHLQNQLNDILGMPFGAPAPNAAAVQVNIAPLQANNFPANPVNPNQRAPASPATKAVMTLIALGLIAMAASGIDIMATTDSMTNQARFDKGSWLMGVGVVSLFAQLVCLSIQFDCCFGFNCR